MGQIANPLPTPFGGAEFNSSFIAPEPLRSSERGRRSFCFSIYKHVTTDGVKPVDSLGTNDVETTLIV
jgi:hypothetical protein